MAAQSAVVHRSVLPTRIFLTSSASVDPDVLRVPRRDEDDADGPGCGLCKKRLLGFECP